MKSSPTLPRQPKGLSLNTDSRIKVRTQEASEKKPNNNVHKNNRWLSSCRSCCCTLTSQVKKVLAKHCKHSEKPNALPAEPNPPLKAKQRICVSSLNSCTTHTALKRIEHYSSTILHQADTETKKPTIETDCTPKERHPKPQCLDDDFGFTLVNI